VQFRAHLIIGLTTPCILLQPLSRPKTLAATTAVIGFQVRLAVILLFIGGALTIAIAVTAPGPSFTNPRAPSAPGCLQRPFDRDGKWAHYSHLLLARLAMLTALMQITGISLPQFFHISHPR
jgi:hypothetical protein